MVEQGVRSARRVRVLPTSGVPEGYGSFLAQGEGGVRDPENPGSDPFLVEPLGVAQWEIGESGEIGEIGESEE